MDNFSDKNDNDDQDFINWQQKNNNNLENCLSNEKSDAEPKNWKTCTVKDDEKCEDILLLNEEKDTNGSCNIEKIIDEDNVREYLSYSKTDDEKSDDSTENLSILNENDLIDDIILLPDNILSDDEMSNPDNCVYAYRGSPEPLRLQQPQEDETDFLEMDFDPEPNSEADSSFLEINNLDNLLNISTTCKNLINTNEKCNEFDKQIHYSSIEQDKNLIEESNSANNSYKECVKSPKFQNNTDKELQKHTTNEFSNILPLKNTGTIPKKPLETNKVSKINSLPSNNISNGHSLETSQNARSNQLPFNHKDENLKNSRNLAQLFKKNEDSSCTRTCNISNKKYHNDVNLYNNCKETDYNRFIIKTNSSNHIENELNFNEVHDKNITNTINLFSINCDEKSLIDALESIGLEPNKNILKNFYIENYEIDTSSMEIPEYLIYLSKQNCNYKKLIQIIRSACSNENLKVSFHPFNDFKIYPDTIKVSIKEILKRWNTNTNLNQLTKFSNKRFNEMNILGKIINILRQPTEIESFLIIPQYYKSGYIRITKI